MLKPAINLQTLPQHSATVISLILAITCAYSLAQMTWMLIPSGDTAISDSSSQHINAPISTQPRNSNIAQLAMAHLFGAAEKTTANSEHVTTVTRLNLVLRGVFAASNPKYGIAIISSGRQGDEKVYGIGDTLPGNATLHEVHAEDVILKRNGQLEILKLPRDTSPNLTGASPGISGYNPASYSNSPGAALGQIRNNIMHNPISFGDYALPMVVREHGKQIGYRLMPQAKGKELLREIGLEPNDIITSVDGVKLNDPRNGINVLRRLTTAQSVNLTVRRNGVDVPLTIQLH